MKNKVTILCGVSGSGKSTRIKTLYPDAKIVSADDFFMRDGKYKFDSKKLGEAHAKCLKDFVGNMLLARQRGREIHIVVDNTNTTVAEIAPYASLALAYGFELQIEILKCDVQTAYERNLHGVPREAIIKMAKRVDALEKELPLWWPKKVV